MAISSPYRSIQRVYFDDLDALNILHNVRFVLFMERARGEMFQAMGFHWDAPDDHNPDKYHVIAEHQVRYLAPVRGTGELLVQITPTRLGTSSVTLEAEVRSVHGDTVYAVGTTRLVRIDSATYRSCPWSDRFRSAITPLLPAV